MKEVVIALDQGTTSSRALAVDRAGKVVASAQREFAQHYPQAGWVEHDPREILESQFAVMDEVLEQTGGAKAIGISNQRETTVLWDRSTGEAVHPAIVWQDRRTDWICASLEPHAKLFTERTGLRLDPYFSGTKLRWLLDHVPGARQRAEGGELAFGTIDSWLVWHLTDGRRHVTDASNASRTLMFDIHRQCWDEDLLRLLDIPPSVLPEVVDSSGVVGETQSGIPISGIAGDQHAALFGQGCSEPGMAKNTYGTGCFLLMQTGAEPMRSKNNLLTTVAWRIGDEVSYALEGSIFVAGALVQWLRDEMGIVASSAEVDERAAEVEDSGGVVIVPAFSGLGAPHWDPKARGLAIGMTRGTNRSHFCRAALESIAFQSAELVRCMEKDSGRAMTELRVDGGATRSDLLMQIQSDLLGAPVVRPRNIETTAMGAAFLAGIGVGFWKSTTEIVNDADERFDPSGEDHVSQWRNWNRAVELAKGWG